LRPPAACLSSGGPGRPWDMMTRPAACTRAAWARGDGYASSVR
jgi:hypothetical protein